MAYTHIIIHYDEIALKHGKRIYFEKLLLQNIRTKTKDIVANVFKEEGQITLTLKEDTKEALDSLEEILKKIPGIAFFSYAMASKTDLDALKKNAVELLKTAEFATFKVETTRKDKSYPKNSMEISALIGEAVIDALRKKVIMKKPDVVLKIEMAKKQAYLSTQTIEGMGGMPTQKDQKVVCLLSGGFDSPVAACMMMKRGCTAVLVHFQNQGQMTTSVEDKVVQIAKQLSQFQQRTTLYIVPFEELQKEIIMQAKAEQRMLIYRYFMTAIAGKIAAKEDAKLLVTGDSLSQVASQTLDNLSTVYSMTTLPIVSPLIGFNKKDIIALARTYGTYELSALPYGDCCSYFVPKHPELRMKKEHMEKALEKFDQEKLIKQATDGAKVLEF